MASVPYSLTNNIIISSLSKSVSKFLLFLLVHCVKILQSLDNSISQKFHKNEASHLRDIQCFKIILCKSMVNHLSLWIAGFRSADDWYYLVT